MTRPSKQRATRTRLRLAGVAFALLALAIAGAFSSGVFSARDPLVVYCAHDSIYSEQLLRTFQQRTGIPVAIRFDTEATKSLGLVNLLLRERKYPRCDVFWNNQLLGTLDLQEEGLLLPYKGKGYERIPDRFKDPGGQWTGFAGRLRVYIVNTQRMSATPASIQRATQEHAARMAVAKPLYGTTRSHYTLLWHRWGREKLVSWHRALRQAGVLEVQGNAMVKNMVAAGKCDFGWTDTDDVFIALDNQQPVEMLPIRLETGETICIPNTVAIIKGTRKLTAAQQLVDFLLSAETELALARSKSRQIPLGEANPEDLPEEVRQLKSWADDACDLRSLGESRQACLQWLKSEYLQ